MMPTQKPYTFAIPTSQRSYQKLQKSMSCQRTGEMKIVANLKDKMTEMKESQPLINRTMSGLQDPAISVY